MLSKAHGAAAGNGGGGAVVTGARERHWVAARMNDARRRLEMGDAIEAERLCRDILAAFADYPDAHNFLSVALGRQGRSAEAEQASRRALALRPDDPGMLLNLGNRLGEQGHVDQALEAWRRALQHDPMNPLLIKKLAIALAERGPLEDAAAIARTLQSSSQPIDPEACMACGRVLAIGKQPDEAIALFEQALEAEPDRIEWALDYARLTFTLERLELARRALERIIALAPEHAEARTMLASILLKKRDFTGMEHLLSGLSADGANAANAVNLTGLMQVAQGKLEEGLNALALVEQLAPDAHELQMTRVMYLNYDPRISREALFEAHHAFGQRFGARVAPLGPPPNARDPERCLKIGLVSPDFAPTR